jgi:YYY domain-containing protein
VLFDWIAREGWIVFNWWLLLTLAGAAALPLCARILGGLPDRGYTLARAAGLLTVGFVFWLLASLGFLNNSTGSIALSWGIVLALGLVVYKQGESRDWRAWWQENKPVIIVGEILFAVLLVGWSVVRAHQNGIFATEKPMDLMFMSGIQRSETFPPKDPWMSGYAISYYYFGYLLAAMLSMMSGISSTVGFNMNISMLFALTGLTAFGVVYNLVRSRGLGARDARKQASHRAALLTGLLGAVFIALLGNFEMPLIEVPYNTRSASNAYLQFWDVNERETPQPATDSGGAAQWQYWWWFRAARALNDHALNGDHIEVIDEFPQFSFLLADNHPHVMGLPFAVLAAGLALNVLLVGRKPNRREILFYAVWIGGLIFLNTWDSPIYLLALLGADALRRLIQSENWRFTGRDWLELVSLGLMLGVLMIVLYLPFLIGFRSQLGGILPNLLNPTLFRQYFLMFGPFLLILPLWLAVEAWRAGRRMNWAFGIQVALVVLVVLALAMILLTLLAAAIPTLRADALNYVDQAGGWGAVLPELLKRRIANILTTLVLLAGIVLVVARLFPKPETDGDRDASVMPYPPETGFALLMVGVGVVLTLVPEFVYLRDNFGTRMNTIFKFYYQAWVVFSIASAYAVYTVLADFRLPAPSRVVQVSLSAVVVLVLVLGLAYPAFGLYSRMFVETGRVSSTQPALLTLDGGRTLVADDDYGAIMCLNQAVKGDNAVVAEAVGNSYHIEEGGRVAALTGIPIVMGWGGHEAQWRGPTFGDVAGTRVNDMKTLFSDSQWDAAQRIIAKYGINYVMFGSSERLQYGTTGEDKFDQNLPVICQQGNTRIYRVVPQEAPANN